MNVIKTKIISLKLAKGGSKEKLNTDTEMSQGKVSYIRRFSVPYGQVVESWKKENMLSACMEEEEYPIYQSASFKRLDMMDMIHFASCGYDSLCFLALFKEDLGSSYL